MTDPTEILCKGGRSGTKIHRGWTTSASTACGIWLRASCSHFRVAVGWDPTDAMRPHLCQHCFPTVERS